MGCIQTADREDRAVSIFEFALLCGVIVAALVSWDNMRAQLWLAAGTADYIVTSGYYAARLPVHPFFTAMVDASVCLLIYFVCQRRGGQRWELGVYTAFWLSVLVGFFRLAGNVSAATYPLLLEVANWIAILCIAGPGILRLADVWIKASMGGHAYDRNRLHHLVVAAHAPARVTPWWPVRAIRRTP